MSHNAYNILGLKSGASKEDIKKAYKDIALSCHPDKLVNLDDNDTKNAKIEKFKMATIAYNNLMNNTEAVEAEDWDLNDLSWKDILDDLLQEDIVKDTIKTLADSFFFRKNQKELTFEHNVSVEVSYSEVLYNFKKKLRLILVDINEPLFIDINCGNFPKVIKEYYDDVDNLHEITINMTLKNQEPFEHIILENGYIDIILNIEIPLVNYIIGYTKEIEYIDGSTMLIEIPSFQKDFFEIPKKGIKGGALYLNISIKYIDKEKWENLAQLDKDIMIRLMKMI